jgi:hypothetical protein
MGKKGTRLLAKKPEARRWMGLGHFLPGAQTGPGIGGQKEVDRRTDLFLTKHAFRNEVAVVLHEGIYRGWRGKLSLPGAEVLMCCCSGFVTVWGRCHGDLGVLGCLPRGTSTSPGRLQQKGAAQSPHSARTGQAPMTMGSRSGMAYSCLLTLGFAFRVPPLATSRQFRGLLHNNKQPGSTVFLKGCHRLTPHLRLLPLHILWEYSFFTVANPLSACRDSKSYLFSSLIWENAKSKANKGETAPWRRKPSSPSEYGERQQWRQSISSGESSWFSPPTWLVSPPLASLSSSFLSDSARFLLNEG